MRCSISCIRRGIWARGPMGIGARVWYSSRAGSIRPWSSGRSAPSAAFRTPPMTREGSGNDGGRRIPDQLPSTSPAPTGAVETGMYRVMNDTADKQAFMTNVHAPKRGNLELRIQLWPLARRHAFCDYSREGNRVDDHELDRK